MTTITLSNQNPDTPWPQISLNILSGECTLPDNIIINRQQLMNQKKFIHPLLTDEEGFSSEQFFHYEYDDIKGLFHTAIYVYSTLLKSTNPLDCRFKINPSPLFQSTSTTKPLYFSKNSHQLAEELIQVAQLEGLVSHLSGYPFKFTDQLIIDAAFTIKDLPPLIDGDLLYNYDEKLFALLNAPDSLSHVELRFINPAIGFGVFSRKDIPAGESVFFYQGKKTIQDDQSSQYTFEHRLDCLNMDIDAKAFGNITRFVNHAPSPKENLVSSLLKANLDTTSHCLQGIEIIVFSSNRKIFSGEQLLINYGGKFFKKTPIHHFKTSSPAANYYKKIIEQNSPKTLTTLRIMAKHDIQPAVRYLRLRTWIIVGIVTLIMGILARN